MKSKEIESFFQLLSEAHPTPQTELFYTNPYTLLVAVVLSAQATDIGVNKVTPALFERAQTPKDMVRLGEEKLRTHIRSIGLYPTKARHLIALSNILVTKYHGQVPNTLEALTSLPGVGRKTANVVLNVVFNQPTIPVDTHVFRVANRTGLATGKTPLAVEKKLLKRVPPAFLHRAHHLLILHGRYICKARNPLCEACTVNSLCAFRVSRY